MLIKTFCLHLSSLDRVSISVHLHLQSTRKSFPVVDDVEQVILTMLLPDIIII